MKEEHNVKTVEIKVCTCTQCVMNGAMDLEESIETLKGLAEELDESFDTDITLNVENVKCLGEDKHGQCSPRVSIDGQLYDKMDSQTLMAEILSIISKDVKSE